MSIVSWLTFPPRSEHDSRPKCHPIPLYSHEKHLLGTQACFAVMLSCICTDALGCHRRQQAAITVLHGSPTVLMAWPGEPVGWIWIMLLHQSSRAMQPCLEMKNEAGCPMVHHLLYVALWCSTAACFYVCHHSAIQHLLASLQAQAEIGNLG